MKAKHILPVALSCVAVATSVAAIAQVNKNKDTKNVAQTALSWEVGSLNDTTGKKTTNTSAIRTKDYYGIAGFKMDVDEEKECSYTLYLYDRDKQFLSKTNEINVDYTFEDDYAGADKEQVAYAKVVLNIDDEDITLFELPGYVAPYSISINK